MYMMHKCREYRTNGATIDHITTFTEYSRTLTEKINYFDNRLNRCGLVARGTEKEICQKQTLEIYSFVK